MADIIFWILFGTLTGWVAALTTPRQPSRIKSSLGIGVLGAIAGGVLGHIFLDFDGQSDTRFNTPSLIAAVWGAIVLLAVFWTVDRQR